MEKVITLSDFSGGLNTSVDESRLEINESSDLRNVEVLDSKAIKRRAGYSRVTATPMRADDVYAVTRQYRAKGTQMWIARTGTGVFYRTDATIEVNELVQAETLGTGLTTESYTGFSGGAAVSITASTTFNIPYSEYVRVSCPTTSASAKIDGGAWVSPSGGYFTFSGLSATTHTVKVKPTGTRNTNALRLTVNGTGSIIAYPATAASATHAWPITTVNKRARIRFYDPYTSSVKPDIKVMLDKYNAASVGGVQVEALGDSYWWSGDVIGPRSAGWHEVELIYLGYNLTSGTIDVFIAFDGVGQGYVTGGGTSLTSTSKLALKCYAYGNTYSTSVDFDDYRIDGNLVDDGSSVDWSSTQLTATASKAATIARYYTGAVNAYVDTIEYKAFGTYTRFAGLSASSDELAIATHNNYIYFGSPHTAIRKYDGSTVSAVTASGAAPPAEFLVNFKRRLFAAGKASDPSLLEYTAVDAPNNWSGGGSLRMTGKDAGGECTGLAVWKDVLWYFAPSRVHALDCTGPDTNWVNRTISDRFGCIAPKSLAVAPSALIFLSADGVRGYGTIPGVTDEDGSDFLWLSEKIQPTIDRINTDALGKVCAAFYNNRYYLSVPLDSATDNSHTLVYRFAEEGVPPSWTLYTYGVTCFCVPRGDENALYGGTTDGHVLNLETGTTDNGAAITMFYRTPPLTADGYASVKHWRRAYIAAEASAQQTLTVTPYTDDTAGQAVTLTVDSSTAVAPIRTPMNARGRSLGVEFESSGSDQSLTISELSLSFVKPRMR